jgi:hypothetical protein
MFEAIVLGFMVVGIILIIVFSHRDKAPDGYVWLARMDRDYLSKVNIIRRILLVYYRPFKLEIIGKGMTYKLLGVPVFGKFIPTGGFYIRRFTGWKMSSYTLESPTLKEARLFLYKSCSFESVHLAALLAQIPNFISGFVSGGLDGIAGFWWNIPGNIYPLMYQRYNRSRMEYLIRRFKK